MFCSQCGKQIPDESSFCQFCGCKLQGTSPVQNTMNAPGRPAGMGSTADASTDRQRYTEVAPNKKNGSFKKWLPISLVVVLTLLIAACVFIYKKRDGQVLIQEKQAEQEQQQDNQQQNSQQQDAQQSNGYEHHIGDAVFYTEHDLWKYIIPKEYYPSEKWLDLETMLRDIWGDVGLLESGNGYFGADGGPTTRAVAFETIGGDFIPDVGYTVKDSYIYVGKNGEEQYDSVVRIYNEKQPPGNWIVVKGFSFGFSPDAAALLLYMLEQNELNPRWNIAGELSLPDNYECGYY